MARPIVLSNGELHVGLNIYGLVHDFYYPYVGFENHAAGANLRHKVGVWIDGTISWLDDEDQWSFSYHYPHTALIGHTLARNDSLGVLLEFDDCVDSHMSLFMRTIHVINLKDQPREIRLFMHQAFAIGDSRSNTDTVQYLPDSNAILHYRGRRAFVVSGLYHDQPFDQFSIGRFGSADHEGSYRDADDGQLEMNPVEHGRVDSVLRFAMKVDAHSSQRAHYWIAAGMSTREALYIHKQMQDDGLDARLHETAKWWREWLKPALTIGEKVPKEHQNLFIESVMAIKSQIDKRGAIIASTDSTLLNYGADNYAYSWPRDGAYVIWALIRMGFKEEAYRFFDFCKRGLHPGGYLMHKYRADGALGSSWHPYVHDGAVAPPIQTDETAIVVFVFAQFYDLTKDNGLIKDSYASMIKPMADFLAEYIDDTTGLPKPSYDLWEEFFMTTTYSTSVTYGALLAAADLAEVAGDDASMVKWRTAAEDIRQAAHKHLVNDERQAFYKGIIVKDGQIEKDSTIDSSAVFGAHMFGLFDPTSSQLKAALQTTLSVFHAEGDTPALPRYEHDAYRRSDESSLGNRWYITSLWYAQYCIEHGDRQTAQAILDWVKQHSLRTGMMGEQVDPATNEIVSPAPLTWTHAEYVSTLLDLISKETA